MRRIWRMQEMWIWMWRMYHRIGGEIDDEVKGLEK